MRPIILATDNSNDVFAFWVYHKQCGVRNRVEVFSDGMDVLRYLQGDPARFPIPALLVANLKMPHTDRLEFLDQLKKRQQDFSTVLLVDGLEGEPNLKTGVESLLERPFRKKEFCEIMSRFQTITMDGCPGTGVSKCIC